jgi:KDO2-lipid IV(A) lauroyltransferase
MHETRSKFGLKLIPTTDVSTTMDEAGSKISAILLLFDQSPHDPSRSHWIRFLNQDTPCFYGPEKYARQYDIPVLYGRVKKVKRGFYETWFEVVTENPLEMKNGEIIERIHALLEVDIRNEPEHWLWSHKRWKHKRDA